MAENLRIDHVIYGTADIDKAASELFDRHGLGSIDGGRHEGRGTGNRIVPLGSAYLELMGIVDAEEAAGHPFGQWFSHQIANGDRFVGWCVGTDDIDAVSQRLGLEVEQWTRATPDGTILTWNLAGLLVAALEPEIPFFIQWTVPEEQHPSKATADHTAQPEGFDSITLSGDEDKVRLWLDGSNLPIAFVPGPSGINEVSIRASTGRVVLP